MAKALKLNAVKFGLAGGIIMGVMVALMVIFILAGYMEPLGGLAQIYGPLGFSYSGLGVFLGLIYGFIDGFILFWVFALLYNCLNR